MSDTTEPAKIVSCRIGPYPVGRSFGQKMPSVNVTMSNGETKDLFTFYPDELSFSEDEFIGLTERQASQLRFEKDKAYLQS